MRQKSRALSNLILVKRRTFYAFNTWIKFGTCEMRCLHRELPALTVTSNSLRFLSVQYVAQYPDGTSIRTLKTKTQFLRRPFQLSVNEVFRMKAEHFSFKMKVLASWKLAKQSQKTPFCSSLSIKAFLRVRGEEILDGSLFRFHLSPFPLETPDTQAILFRWINISWQERIKGTEKTSSIHTLFHR